MRLPSTPLIFSIEFLTHRTVDPSVSNGNEWSVAIQKSSNFDHAMATTFCVFVYNRIGRSGQGCQSPSMSNSSAVSYQTSVSPTTVDKAARIVAILLSRLEIPG